MATTNGRPKGKPGPKKKLVKGSPGYFETIGRKGGEACRDNHADGFFSRLAKLSHLNRHKPKKTPAKKKPNPAV